MGGEFPPGGEFHPLPQFSALETPPPKKRIERDIARRDHFSFQKDGNFLINLLLLESEGGSNPSVKFMKLTFFNIEAVYFGRQMRKSETLRGLTEF